MLRILIAEDNLDIAENIGDFFTLQGHQVDFAYDGIMALELIKQLSFDAVIMDINMPRLNGLDATHQIRQLACGDLPILMLTAKDTLDDKINGLESGADDYIVKPFEITELYARVLAQTRKANKNYRCELSMANLILDQSQQRSEVNGEPLVLNPTTFKILWRLCKAYPALVDKSELSFELWQEQLPDNDILRSHIYNLRQSLSLCCDHLKVLSKRGKGYQLIIENEAQQ